MCFGMILNMIKVVLKILKSLPNMHEIRGKQPPFFSLVSLLKYFT